MTGTLRLLLPALLPSWRFFSGVGPSPRIEIRSPGGPWHEADPLPACLSPAQMLLRLVWNPRWNDRLFLVSLSERLAETPEDPWIIAQLQARIARDLPPGPWQWRLVFLVDDGQGLRRDVIRDQPLP